MLSRSGPGSEASLAAPDAGSGSASPSAAGAPPAVRPTTTQQAARAPNVREGTMAFLTQAEALLLLPRFGGRRIVRIRAHHGVEEAPSLSLEL